MAFKMITLSEREVGRIAGNAGAHAEIMARDLTLKWRSQLPKDQKVIDVLQVQLCVRQDLHRMRREIGAIEREHIDRLELEGLSRDVRDVTIPQLRGQLVGIQSLFEGNFGAGSSSKVFGPLVTTIPLDPRPLRRVAAGAFEKLVDPAFTLPASQLGGVKIVPRDLAKGFEPLLIKLDQVLLELEDTLPVSNESLERKIKALADLRLQVGIAARFLEALYFLAGHDEVARRVRISSHRSRRLEAGSGGDGEPEPPAGGDAPAAGGEAAADEAAADPAATDAVAGDEAYRVAKAA